MGVYRGTIIVCDPAERPAPSPRVRYGSHIISCACYLLDQLPPAQQLVTVNMMVLVHVLQLL